jgi:hypothetical protein
MVSCLAWEKFLPRMLSWGGWGGRSQDRARLLPRQESVSVLLGANVRNRNSHRVYLSWIESGCYNHWKRYRLVIYLLLYSFLNFLLSRWVVPALQSNAFRHRSNRLANPQVSKNILRWQQSVYNKAVEYESVTSPKDPVELCIDTSSLDMIG